MSYLGANLGGDIKATLENGVVFSPPEPIDPITANNYEDDKDKEGKLSDMPRIN